MKLRVYDEGGSNHYWRAEVWDDDKMLLSSGSHNRPGCAIREALNTLMGEYGKPHAYVFEWSLDEW